MKSASLVVNNGASVRNVVAPEDAEASRPGGFTFHAPVPDDYAGLVVVVVVLRLGDHAHLDIYSGRHVPTANGWPVEGRLCVGSAGRLILRWPEWLALRPVLAAEGAPVLVREVANPTDGQLREHTGSVA